MHLLLDRKTRLSSLLAILFMTLALVGLPALADGPKYQPTERLGVSFLSRIETPEGWVSQSISDYNLGMLAPGWYSDWAFSASPAMPADMQSAALRPDYAQLIRVSDRQWPPDWSAVQNAVELNTGSLWMIGNEPECPNQDAVTPAVYAARYREAYQRIKGWDPTAQIANGAIVEVTPLRLAWLGQVLAAYQTAYGEAMQVDVWNIHVQILSEGNEEGDAKAGAGVPVFAAGEEPEGVWPRYYTDLRDNASLPIFKSMVLEFREWMYDQGQSDRELIISEMGVLYPSDYLAPDDAVGDPIAAGDRVVEQFMVGAFEWLYQETDTVTGCPSDEYRLVQRYLWYALNDVFFWRPDDSPSGFNGSLYDYATLQPTRFGQQAIAYQNRYKALQRLHIPLVTKL